MQIPTSDTRIPTGLHILLNPTSTRLPAIAPATATADCQVPAGHRRVTVSTDLLHHSATTRGPRRRRR
ncbi:hypothetical protein VAB18032_07300 [Micromonospora maris AB-18-032]|uniref:Uncharacterized protein n=1 Tax=Micromonospora maris TaxID=1003110 RepID=A0A9X0I6P5_9ACTN|nr:hypothetical protein VAB18032_07300 [Micromonospora maris AB-18-032]KUJ48028.1 hypothetical protein ADL17_02785 [Micromonospora maris]